MDAKNLFTITNSNLRLNMKQTLFPAILLLFVIPLIYGTSNLDSVKSADCLERMVALIGLPIFVPLLKPEQNGGMDAIITMRPFPYRMIVVLRVVLSLICTVALWQRASISPWVSCPARSRRGWYRLMYEYVDYTRKAMYN